MHLSHTNHRSVAGLAGSVKRPGCPALAASRRRAGHAASAQQTRPRRGSLDVHAIGFDFGDREEPQALTVTPAANANIPSFGVLIGSLLVYQHVFKGGVGEAFQAAVETANRFQAKNKDIVTAYSRFFQLMLTSGYDTWQDYVLDQVLLGRDNAFARAVAQGNLEPGAPVLQAVAYDLDVLQQLSLPLSQLAQYICSVAPTVPPYWKDCAASVSVKAPSKRTGSKGELPSFINLPPSPPKFVQRPPGPEELQQWKDAIAGHNEWSEAVPLLQQYYSLHGYGITSRNTLLRWTRGLLEEVPDPPDLAVAPSAVAANEAARLQLERNTLRHVEGLLPAQHALLAGPAGTGKSWLLWESTLRAGGDKGLRVVEVSATELPNLAEAARGCGRYPRLRFILVVDGLELPLRGAGAADLATALGGGMGGWPENTLLYASVSSQSAVSYSEPLVSRFGLVLTTSELEEAEFGTTLESLLQAGSLADEQLGTAVRWARQHGGLTLRTATMYSRLFSAQA